MNEANGKSVDRPCGRIKMVPIYASDDVIDEVKIVAFDSEKKKFVLRVNSRPCKTQRHILWQGLRPFFHAVNPREFKILVIET